MGFGYLGCYIAYGFDIEEEDFNKFYPNVKYMKSNIFKIKNYDNIYIKQYGGGEDDQYFLFWSLCFQGGGLWESNVKNSEYKYCQPIENFNKEQCAEIENSYDPQTIEKCVKEYGNSNMNFPPPQWKMLCTMGSCQY